MILQWCIVSLPGINGLHLHPKEILTTDSLDRRTNLPTSLTASPGIGLEEPYVHEEVNPDVRNTAWEDKNLIQALISGPHGLVSIENHFPVTNHTDRFTTRMTSTHSVPVSILAPKRNVSFPRIDQETLRVKQLHKGQSPSFEFMTGFDDRWTSHIQQIMQGTPRRTTFSNPTGFLVVMEPQEAHERAAGKDPAQIVKISLFILIVCVVVVGGVYYGCREISKPSQYYRFHNHEPGVKCPECSDQNWNNVVGSQLHPRYVQDLSYKDTYTSQL